jgi:uncharacterized protein (TIGR02145 family)
LKHILFVIAIVFLPVFLLCQVPEKMNYQAVLRDSDGSLLINRQIKIRFSIIASNTEGSAVYQEIQQPITSSNGLISVEIGAGETSDSFTTINWSDGPYFIKTEINTNNNSGYSLTLISELLSVPYAFHAKTANNLLEEVPESDPIFESSTAAGITTLDTANWNNPLKNLQENDPVFNASIAAEITPSDTFSWNNKLDSFDESDPVFSSSVAAGITTSDTSSWNNPLKNLQENDPVFNASIAAEITPSDTSSWNNKLDSFNESDPVFSSSVSAGITTSDTSSWNNPLKNLQENDPVFNASIAAEITPSDTSSWNNKLDSFNESDPVFSSSVSAGITASDTSNWNNSNEVDSSITNEIQEISRNGLIVTLNRNGGTYTDSINVFDGNMNNKNITNLNDPVNLQDAVTKKYVDNLFAQLYAQGALRVRDYDGNYYNTIQIGNQIWMTENLKTTTYANGDSIKDGIDIGNLSLEETPKYWFAYDNDKNNIPIYGNLYTWYAINDERNICPSGWHIPSLSEWSLLIDHLGGEFIAGGKLKERGTIHWNTPNDGATNSSGFQALPGGVRGYGGPFGNLQYGANYWTSTEKDLIEAYNYGLSFGNSSVYYGGSDKKVGFSVRCIKD